MHASCSHLYVVCGVWGEGGGGRCEGEGTSGSGMCEECEVASQGGL